MEEAEIICREVVRLSPEKLSARVVLAEILLSQGKYAEGFAYYETWPELAQALGQFSIPSLPFPRWTGEDLTGKSILILPCQGLGDQIQYSRFVPELVRMGATVSMIVPPALAKIFGKLGADIIPLSGGARISAHDYWTFPLSLPNRLGVTVNSIDGRPYLSVGAQIGSRIGLVWQGNPDHPNDANRSASREVFADLFDAFDVLPLGLAETKVSNFAETAALMETCKLVISVDTATAHLAGAIGKQCWLVLPAVEPDWRWMSADRSPWYQSMRIFRQRYPGDWASVLDDIIFALAN